jgi:hypothetical protein
MLAKDIKELVMAVSEREAHALAIDALCRTIEDMKERCDHLMPDGHTAIFGRCIICGNPFTASPIKLGPDGFPAPTQTCR